MAYGPFDPDGRRLPSSPPAPPPKRNPLPWLLVGGAVLLSALGILLVVLLRDGHPVAPAATPATTTAASAPAPTPTTHGPRPGGGQVVDEAAGVGRARFPGSADTALAWVQAMSDGDFQTAYDLSCADVQQAATAAAADGPAGALGEYFFDHTLGGRGLTDGTFDSLIYNSDSDSDIASFSLHLDDGEEFLLLVYVQADGKVCDFV